MEMCGNLRSVSCAPVMVGRLLAINLPALSAPEEWHPRHRITVIAAHCVSLSNALATAQFVSLAVLGHCAQFAKRDIISNQVCA